MGSTKLAQKSMRIYPRVHPIELAVTRNWGTRLLRLAVRGIWVIEAHATGPDILCPCQNEGDVSDVSAGAW